jgi:hypothetical protein
MVFRSELFHRETWKYGLSVDIAFISKVFVPLYSRVRKYRSMGRSVFSLRRPGLLLNHTPTALLSKGIMIFRYELFSIESPKNIGS